MSVNIDITDQEIVYAEGILLPSGKHFDKERRDFIKCLRTVDLQAVPGSGKTTALLAKLLILEQHLPFHDGSGILVISHTNAAVNEIKNKIGKYCPKLFAYPNFVGTIQSFVDIFLAIPYFSQCFENRPTRIDSEIYHEYTNDFSRCFLKGFTKDEGNRAKYYLNINRSCSSYRFALDGGHNIALAEDVSGRPLQIKKPRGNAKNYIDWSDTEKARIKEWLIAFKCKIMRSGILCFDDAYFLAEYSILKAPKIISFLRNRFCLVFVDEMQDMAKHQHDLLEKLFFQTPPLSTVFQRIGDKNQAIFNGRDISIDGFWIDRDEVLRLNNSQRLSSLNARILEPFALNRSREFAINGLQPVNIKPHIILYDDDTFKHLVVERFAKLIIQLYEEGKIQPGAPKIFKTVAWSTSWDDSTSSQGKLRLIDFCPSFHRAQHKKLQEFDTLADYLSCVDPKDQTLSSARKSILNGILKALRIEEVMDPRNERPFTISSLIGYFMDYYPSLYDHLNLRLFRLSRSLVTGQIEPPLNKLRMNIPKILRLFGKSLSRSKDFLNNPPSPENLVSNAGALDPNILRFGNVDVELATIHSVKGQTHTATLYLESYYYSDGHGSAAKSYESQRLAEQIKGTPIIQKVGTHVKESAKMVYVGFSRPTHLLCFAVHKDRFNQYLPDIDTEIWEIIKLYEEIETDVNAHPIRT